MRKCTISNQSTLALLNQLQLDQVEVAIVQVDAEEELSVEEAELDAPVELR